MPNRRLFVPEQAITAADLADTARHEAGHLVLIEHVGGKVRRGTTHIRPDGSGECGTDDGIWFPEDTPVECLIATDLAGVMAQGVHLDTWAGSEDKANIQLTIVEHGLSVEDAVLAMQKARQIAAFGLRVHAKRLHKIAQRLEKRGRA